MSKTTHEQDKIGEGVAGFVVAEGSPRRRKKKRSPEESLPLSINSLMDIVTIVLIYLLKSFATSAIEVNDPATNLPISTSTESAEEATVVMLTGAERSIRNDAGQTITAPNTPALFVDGKLVTDLVNQRNAAGEVVWRISNEKKSGNGKSRFVVKGLVSQLEKAKKKQEDAADLLDKEFDGKVVIVADQKTPYRVLMDLLVSCGQAGFGEFRFAIIKDSEG